MPLYPDCPACKQGLGWDGHTEHAFGCPERVPDVEGFQWRDGAPPIIRGYAPRHLLGNDVLKDVAMAKGDLAIDTQRILRYQHTPAILRPRAFQHHPYKSAVRPS